MSPKKSKTAKGEKLAPALATTRINTTGALDKIEYLVAGRNNEHGVSILKTATLGKLAKNFYPIFLHTLFAGLVPPFSPFLEEVLEFYQIRLLHLHPNSVLILAIFAYLCEAYLGVKPSVAFFRCFYALRSSAQSERSGCVSFRIADGMGGVYIPMSWDDGKPVTCVTKKVDDFRLRWLVIDAKAQNSFYDVPEAPPQKNSHWKKEGLQSPKIVHLVARMKLVRDAGLTGQMVAEDFVKRRIAPLQSHTKPMWMYSGPMDAMRLHCSDHSAATVAHIMGTLFINPVVPVPRNDDTRPLHQLSMAKRLAVLEVMPEFTPLGLAGEEKKDAAAPMVEEEGAAGSPAASDADLGAATGEAKPSAGEASSSKRVPPEAEVLDVSSGEDEDFLVVPSRPIAEDDEISGLDARTGRREPRTKELHDRPSGDPEGTPLKRKAETALEGSGAGSVPSRPWRSAGMAWVDTRARKSG